MQNIGGDKEVSDELSFDDIFSEDMADILLAETETFQPKSKPKRRREEKDKSSSLSKASKKTAGSKIPDASSVDADLSEALPAEDLMTLTARMIDALNSANMAQMTKLIGDNFEEDCEFVHSALNGTRVGRQSLIDYFKALMESFPDATKFCKKTKQVGWDLVTETYFVGHHLFDLPNHQFFEKLLVNEKKGTDEAVARYKILKSQGKRYELYGTGTDTLTFNANRRIVRIVFDRFVNEVHDVNLGDEEEADETV